MTTIDIAVVVGSVRRDSLNRKLADDGHQAVSVGAMGTAMAQQHLRNILA
jgi:NAD(P)H-dependent FMN reductase